MTDANETQAQEAQQSNKESDSFPRSYVEELREENKQRRIEAKQAQEQLEKLEARLKAQETQKLEEQNNFKELYEQQKQEVQSYKEKVNSMQQQVLKAQVASQYGLPPKLAERLSGSSLEELEADAKELSTLIPQSTRRTSTASVPSGESVVKMSKEQMAKKFLYGDVREPGEANVDTDGKTYWRFTTDR